MIGKMIEQIRKEKGISKTELSNLTGINIGHLTHIEKGERNPSHKALSQICEALCVPYQELFYTYDKTLTEDHINNDYIKYIPYDKVPLISNISDYITCPSKYSKASFAIKVSDSAMEPLFKQGDTVFVEQAGILENKDIGVFKFNNEILIRKFIYKKNKFILKANNKYTKDITISSKDTFLILGKVYI